MLESVTSQASYRFESDPVGTTKVNAFITQSQKDEQEGIRYLSVGLVSAFRNTAAHELSLSWPVSEEDCLDILSLISFLFKKLDDALF